jgi:hypothetical protein
VPKPKGEPLKIKVRDHTPWREIFGNLLGKTAVAPTWDSS